MFWTLTGPKFLNISGDPKDWVAQHSSGNIPGENIHEKAFPCRAISADYWGQFVVAYCRIANNKAWRVTQIGLPSSPGIWPLASSQVQSSLGPYPPDAAPSEQQVLLGKEISAQWGIVVCYKMPVGLLGYT